MVRFLGTFSYAGSFMRMLRLLQSGEFRVEISAARLSLCPLRPRLSLARSDLDTDPGPRRGKVVKCGRTEQVSRNGSCDELSLSLSRSRSSKSLRDSIGA